MHPLGAGRVDQRADVLDDLRDAVIPPPWRSGTGRISPLVRGQTPVSLCGQPVDHRVPARVELREPVQQHDDGSVSRTGVDHIESQLAAVVLLHAYASSISSGVTAAPVSGM